MDKIFLHGMKADTLIGVYDWEREQMQTLLLDLDIGVAEQSAASDHIDDTIHYGDVCEAVRQSLREQSFLLLEALAEQSKGAVAAEAPVQRVHAIDAAIHERGAAVFARTCIACRY